MSENTQEDRIGPDPTNDALTGAVGLLAAAAMYEGESREDVEAAVKAGLEIADTHAEEIADEFPAYAEAVAPHMTDAIEEIRKWSGDEMGVEE